MDDRSRSDRWQPRPAAPRPSALAGGEPLDVAVVVPRDHDGNFLIRELQRTRARVRHFWPAPDRLPEDADVVFAELAPGLAQRIPWSPGEAKAALVAVMPMGAAPDLVLLKKCAVDAALHRPVTAAAVLTSLTVAIDNFTYGRRLRSRINKLDETLRAMHNVERAKAILMTRDRMQEEEAYHYLRRQAMDRHVSISTVAATIVDSHEILS